MAFQSGWTGYVKVNGVVYRFGKWKLSIKAGSPKTTNFAGGGYQTVVPGVVSGTLTLSGAFDVGGMPLVANGVYVFTLGLNTGLELSVTAQVTSIDPDNDVEGTPQLSVTAETTGPFTAAVS